MKKHYLLWLLMALLPIGANAQNTMTVADGSATSSYVPIWGLWTDAYLHSQIIYPADSLVDMENSTITKLVWYMQSTASSAWGINVVISVAEVPESTLETASDSWTSISFNTASLEQVWSGAVNGTTDSLVIDFASPFSYEGGNLLIDVQTTTTGTYSSCYWYGSNVTGASASGYNSTSAANATAYQRDFLPKTTFTFTPQEGICNKPGNIVFDDVNPRDVTFHWHPRGTATLFEVSMGDSILNPATTDTSYTVVNLHPETQYTFGVRAICGADDTSSYTRGGTTTAVSCQWPAWIMPDSSTLTSITFHWTGGSAPYIIYVDGQVVEPACLDTFYTATGLTPSTRYTIGVRTDCRTDEFPDDTSHLTTTSMTTACGVISEFPYSNNLESGEALCWLPDYDWYISDYATAASGIYTYYTYESNYDYYSYDPQPINADAYLISPLVSVPEGSNLSFSFMVMGESYSETEDNPEIVYEVMVSTTGAETADNSYTAIFSDTLIHNAPYKLANVNLSDYAGQTIRVALHHTTYLEPYSEAELYVDNFNFNDADAPILSISDATTDAGLANTYAVSLISGDTTGITYTWTSTMASAGNAVMVPADSHVGITYSIAGTDTLSVSATNSHGTATATMYVTVRDCPAIDSLPYSVAMATQSDLDCWTAFGLTSYSWEISTYSSAAVSSTYGSAIDDWLLSPQIVIPEDADGLVLSYECTGSAYNTVYDDIEATYMILVSPTAGMSAADFTDTLFAGLNPDNWTMHNIPLEAYAGQTVRFAFRHYSNAADLYSSSMALRNFAVRMSLAPVVTLAGPGIVQLGETATFTAGLSEGTANELTYTFSSTAATAGNATSVADDNTLTVTYNTVGSDTVKVVATNEFGSDSTIMVVTVADFQPAAIPYFTSFEPADEDTVWFYINDVNAWYIDTAAHAVGNYALYISSDSGASNTYNTSTTSNSYAYRALDIAAAGDYAIQFKWHGVGEYNYSPFDFLRVFLAPMTTNLTDISFSVSNPLPEGVIAVDGNTYLANAPEWTELATSVTIDDPGNYFLVFLWHNDYTVGSNPSAAIDSISVTAVSCRSVADITVDTVTANMASLHWTPRGEETSWVVTIDSTDFIVTDTLFSIDTLQGNTDYHVTVRAICGEGDTSFAASTMFTTVCDSLTLPYFEGFEDNSFACWSTLTSGTYTYLSIDSYEGYNSQQSLYFSNYSISGKGHAILPALDNINTLMITFYANMSSAGRIEIGTMTDPENASTFTPLDTVEPTSIWEQYEVRLAAAPADANHIALRFSASSYNGTTINIDNLEVSVAPNCLSIVGVDVSDIDSASATITIDDPTEENNYQVYVVNVETEDTVYNSTITSTSLQVTGLDANTDYTVIAYAICSDGNSTTARRADFRTDCTNGSCHFTVSMNDSFGDGWNGASIEVLRGDEQVYDLTIGNGNHSEVAASTCRDAYTSLKWHSGSFDSEVSFIITDEAGDTLFSAYGDMLNDNDLLLIFDHNCNLVWTYGDEPLDTTPIPCDVPTFTATNATETTITVVWSGTAERYQLAIVEGEWSEPANVTTAVGPSYTFTGLHAGTLYSIGVRAICAQDTTSTWAVRIVNTPSDTTPDGIDDVMAATFGLYPNPASSTVTVDLGGESTALVAVIDQSGRTSGEWKVESGKLEINVSDMAKGAYFVRVTTATATSVRKLIVK